ncbi:MAG: helix-turn-helix domain-containing protein [Bacteroidaceae bacterium]|nr:helix-turn-helix domain-containing protein [Bacteroidaceae bacterium]
MTKISTDINLAMLLAGESPNDNFVWYMNKVLVMCDVSLSDDFVHQFVEVPLRFEAFVFLLVNRGAMQVKCDLHEYTLHDDSVLILNPRNTFIIKESEECKFSMMAIDKLYFKSLKFNRQILLPLLNELVSTHCFLTSKNSASLIGNAFRLIADVIKSRIDESLYYEQLKSYVQSTVLLLVSNIIHAKKAVDDKTDVIDVKFTQTYTDTEQTHFKTFLHNISVHFKEEHKVAYYADLQCVSQKYLSTVVKKVSDKGCHEWITFFLIKEACHLLRYSELSIKQISTVLHFPNESFFGKYFKQHKGMSPGQYRESEIIIGEDVDDQATAMQRN